MFEESLTTDQKKLIAKQLDHAETAFIAKSEIADYRFEYFTPRDEVALCGHTIIGSFAALLHCCISFKETF
ncbi:PhzF family phenazine biosynthesis protein [Liquorilactobacillus capillatus]|uniref:PhzF family phenazine biosynthesis protein n=1 Tax=Liquorilactobacillus capillatus TaxID=480931 RepID=UPI00070D02AF|nr:PhzF family phenazine biosynthesis protein [Liquorilactobacillus capillatus]